MKGLIVRKRSPYCLITSTLWRSSRFLEKALTKIDEQYVKKLESTIIDKIVTLEKVPKGIIISIVDEDDAFFFRIPNHEKVYQVDVGWQRDGYEQPRDAVGAIKLVARKARQVFARVPFVPIKMRQEIIHDVHEWEKAALAAESAKE